MSGLYLHIPFCRQKCHYCDFHFNVSQRHKSEMIVNIGQEILLRKNELTSPIETIYFGGGTPSLLIESELAQLLSIIYDNYHIIPQPEITLEANPDDLTEEYLKFLKKAGINRLSIGVQSFHDAELQLMNRSHSAKTAINAVKKAQQLGIDNISIDLIYGVQGSNPDSWQQNLEQFLVLNVPHLSAYALTIEEKTVLHHWIKKGKIPPTDEDTALAQFESLRNFMSQNGYQHYELSNFAKEDFISQHNSSYWLGRDYLGFGPSAHSLIGTTRSWNVADNHQYSKHIAQNRFPKTEEKLTTKELYNEYLMTRLRTYWGIETKVILQNFGIDYVSHFQKNAALHFQNHNLREQSGTITIHPKALFYSDKIISDLFWV